MLPLWMFGREGLENELAQIGDFLHGLYLPIRAGYPQ
jgi:hypothetical protein